MGSVKISLEIEHSNMRLCLVLIFLGLLLVTDCKKKDWKCKDKKGRKRACLPKDAVGENGFYILSNDQTIMITKVADYCNKEENTEKPECPKRCDDDSYCYEQVCPPYTPCTEANGKVLMVKSGKPKGKEEEKRKGKPGKHRPGRPYFHNLMKGLRGTFFVRKNSAPACRCFIPRVHSGPVFVKQKKKI